jgi:hypothetical protein
MCRAILENPSYRTLNFAAPFISRVYCNSLEPADTSSADTMGVRMGRLTFVVQADERVELITPLMIESYQTKVLLDNAEDGYLFYGSTSNNIILI